LKEHSDCDIFLSLYGDATGLVSDEMAARLADLGLKTDVTALSDGECLVAWLTNDGTSVEEATDDGYVRINGEMENGVAYDIASRNRGEGEQMTRLSIGGEDQSVNTAGLNITVYDQEQDLVIETVCIDLETGEMTCVTRAD
ncbi:MAG: hypothetical protein LUH45_07535, partial [Clostridiales bacterium]|nr:hypothetical protein [Clostridiales bacterium]